MSITEVFIPQKIHHTPTLIHPSPTSTHPEKRQSLMHTQSTSYIVPDITHRKAYDAYLKNCEERILTTTQKVSVKDGGSSDFIARSQKTGAGVRSGNGDSLCSTIRTASDILAKKWKVFADSPCLELQRPE
ncbi:hypothetical protein H7F10_16210 [Acidithiobacillus sp. HP-6]|uniref:hypothetical protein n=1 Tax=unclassified Acidithiobacillus TaxID=2614800 RepID=UPI001879A1A9|nr:MULTISPECIES: hypothetical protein [unclassified Acidithiobacillus]MBE7564427.1 hypothetical protein [Acidithiobacillus sp. HP-6]MBE7570381.1 hypothetical protein [Acidithiobacillus sp. HP-2]